MLDKNKAIRQFKLQLNGVMSPFNLYGLTVHITPAIEAITILALQLHERLNGKDIPIMLNNYRNKRG